MPPFAVGIVHFNKKSQNIRYVTLTSSLKKIQRSSRPHTEGHMRTDIAGPCLDGHRKQKYACISKNQARWSKKYRTILPILNSEVRAILIYQTVNFLNR